MVFREETMVQVRSFVDKLEKEPRRASEVVESEILQNVTAPLPEETPRKSTLPVTRQARSCLASGLFHNVYKGRMRKVKFLLDNGLNINAKNDYGYGVLIAALHIENDTKRSKMFQFLLENEADPLQKDPKHQRNALAWACLLGRDEQANLLLDCFMGEFNFHEKDKEGMTALHLATQAGRTEVVKTLVREMTKYGMSVDVPDNLGLSPYLHAKRLGFGLIADILKVEGGACEGQGDKYSFKRANEWRDIGIRERNEEYRVRRDTLYEHAAISGSARMLMEFEGPGYEIISIPTPRTRTKPSNRSKSSSDAEGIEKDAQRSVRILSPRSQNTISVGTNDKAFGKSNRMFFDTPDGSRKLDTMSLIQMREPKKGIAPKQFHSSELDTNKASEYNQVLGDLTTMMDYLSMQHCKSFRQSVPPMKPKREESGAGPKRSTLAIIFGKNKRGKKSPNSGKKGKRSPGSGGKEKRHGKSK